MTLTSSRKRQHSDGDCVADYVPISKKMNNLHINCALNTATDVRDDESTSLSNGDEHDSNTCKCEVCFTYIPTLSREQNPIYYEQNRVLFEANRLRLCRQGRQCHNDN